MSGARTIGGYEVALPEGEPDARWAGWLADLPAEMAGAAHVLAGGRNRVARLAGPDGHSGKGDIVVKMFGRQAGWKDRIDRRQGSKAARSWRTATHLATHGVGTPEPLGFADRWEGDRLRESYLFTRWVPRATNLRAELIRIYSEEPRCADLMALLQAVADAARSLHDAGVIHRDLGNQNIMLTRAAAGDPWQVRFLDLNRARIQPAVDEIERAKDLSRLHLPSDMLRVLFEMYLGARPGKRFRRVQARSRRVYAWHDRTRRLRHPLRERRTPPDPYPAEKDIWIWDDRSVQAISVLTRKDRVRLRSKVSAATATASTLRLLPSVWSGYRQLLGHAYRDPVPMTDRIGIAVEPPEGAVDDELARLEELGPIPVLLRFYHHEHPASWARTADIARRLHGNGHAVSVALVQCRQSVKDPGAWGRFLGDVLDRVHGIVDEVEVGHAINRVKWGVWSWRDYARFMEPVAEARSHYPAIRWMGPACIDFEYPHVAAALSSLPDGVRFGALSHHLYVDRRGAPENRQGRFSTLEKAALARAVAMASPRCEDRFVISEVNWPILGAGVYSPVVSPYDTPGPRSNDPSVSEEDYARFMIRYLLITLCSGMADRVFWWRLVSRGFGLIDDTDASSWRPRPAYWMLKDFLARVGAARFVGRHAGDGAHFFRFEHDDGRESAIGYREHDGAGWAPPFSYGDARALAATAEGGASGLNAWPANGEPVFFERPCT